MSSTHAALERLCSVLDQELERQELLHGIVRAQHAAIREQDYQTLEARTEAIAVLARDSRDAESERHALFDQLAAAYELPAGGRNMSGLIAACPAPFSRRLKELQAALRGLLEATQQQVQDNARLVQRSLRVVKVSLAAAQPDSQPTGYPGMHAPGGGKSAPVLIDQRG
jgi:hypothetical protein